ncbi:MAG: hypothetical protein ACJ0OL_05430 [Dehalococcoidia bacterium]
MTFKRLVILLVFIGFVLFNPIHLGWTLPYVAKLDHPVANLLDGNEQNVLIFSTIYFTAVMMPIYYWIWTRRRKTQTKQKIENSVGESYIGPGGGKKRPKNKRNPKRRNR